MSRDVTYKMSRVNLLFSRGLVAYDPRTRPVLIVGQLKNLTKVPYDVIKIKLEPRETEKTYRKALGSLHPSPTDSCPMWLNNVTLAALPTKCSRHNTPARTHALTRIVRSFMCDDDECIVVVCERGEALASACAVARAFPLYSRKSGVNGAKRTVTVEFVIVANGSGSEAPVGPLSETEVSTMSDAACSVRLAARITDTPCSEMNTDNFLEEVCKIGEKLGIEPHIIQGEELRTRGFGGLYAVGKAAVHAPVLAVLSHRPEGARQTIAWVGKGIVYDTGGLSIKGMTTMQGMKRDCGGAAAVLGAFYATVKQGFGENLHAVFCLAENAVGPHSLRPDDIITLYSGRTVEVNNTDAEGRLVLGDGVAYASKDLKADIIVDMATLTGAQGFATGRYHGALVTNNEDWEAGCGQAGRVSGDLLHPLLYCPELHFSEFASAIADMKNSSADRNNAEVSCAGLFIEAHLGFDFPGTWLHVDMAYPVYSGERATGYGVALLLVLFGKSSHSALLRHLAPSLSEDGDVNDESASKKMKLAW